MVIIHTEKESARLTYICKQLFGTILGCEWQISTQAADNATIWYAATPPKGRCVHIPTCGLLAESGLRPQRFESGVWDNLPTIFAQPQSADVPFDLFAAAFYLICRYEEYTNPTTDAHGRFPAEESIAYKNGFLERPLVDLWCQALKKRILEINPSLQFNPPAYRFIPTIDVDNIFAYRNHGVLQTAYCCLRDWFKGEKKLAKERLRVVARLQPDPQFNLKEVEEMHRRQGLSPLFFFHCGAFGKHDKRTIFPSLSYRKFRKEASEEVTVGLHPSYHCSTHPWLLKAEEKLMFWHSPESHPIRFHYLRIHLPETYELIEQLGITDDWSLCYGNRPGFRASTAHSFPFYNLRKEEETKLIIHPTCVMDKTLQSDLKMTADESRDYILKLKTEVQNVGGCLITLFHNQHLNNKVGWEGWKEMYETLLAKCKSHL